MSTEPADYVRMAASLVASWRAFATRAEGAEVRGVGEASAAIFPRGPASAIFNNALLRRGAADVPATLHALQRAYAAAGVAPFALWVHCSDAAALAACAAAGWREDDATRAMTATLAPRAPAAVSRRSVIQTTLDVARVTVLDRAGDGAVERLGDPREALLLNGVAAELLPAWPAGGRAYVVRDAAGQPLSTALALDHDGDCAVSFVATAPQARRRGHAGRVLARLLADAAAADCTTASLHSTAVAEPLYAAAGFRDLGRMVELQPPPDSIAAR